MFREIQKFFLHSSSVCPGQRHLLAIKSLHTWAGNTDTDKKKLSNCSVFLLTFNQTGWTRAFIDAYLVLLCVWPRPIQWKEWWKGLGKLLKIFALCDIILVLTSGDVGSFTDVSCLLACNISHVSLLATIHLFSLSGSSFLSWLKKSLSLQTLFVFLAS